MSMNTYGMRDISAQMCIRTLFVIVKRKCENTILSTLRASYSVSHVTWNPPRQHAAAAATKLPRNESSQRRTQPSHARTWVSSSVGLLCLFNYALSAA
jgi:hypothetical protein